MSTTFMSAAELASLSLPGLPSSDRRIREKAQRENWTARRALSRKGGGLEYAIDSIPEPARIALAQQKLDLSQGSATAARLAHNQEAAGSTPAPATPCAGVAQLEEQPIRNRQV